MLIDFQSKFNNFNDVRFSDQVSGCDFEFSSVLRRWWEGGMKGYNGEDMEGVWSVQQITLYWTFTTSANIIVIVVVCFHLLLFLTFWNSQLDFLQIADKFWIGANFNQFCPSFQFFYLPYGIFGGKFCCYMLKRIFLLFVFWTRLDTVRLNFVMTCFFVHLTTSKKIGGNWVLFVDKSQQL